MPMVPMEATIFVLVALIRVSFHLPWPLQGWIVFDLHEQAGRLRAYNPDSWLGGLPSYYPCLSYLPFVPSSDEDLVWSDVHD